MKHTTPKDTSARTASPRFSIDEFDCELPPAARTELLAPKRARMLKRPPEPPRNASWLWYARSWWHPALGWLLVLLVLVTLGAGFYLSRPSPEKRAAALQESAARNREVEQRAQAALESLRRPVPASTPTPAAAPTPSGVVPTSPPRAQLVKLPTPRATLVALPELRAVQNHYSHQSRGIGHNGRRKVNALSFHSLRRTATTWLHEAGVADAVAQSLIGHSSKAVHDTYVFVGREALQTAVATLPSIGGL
jgi:hypothetical protein